MCRARGFKDHGKYESVKGFEIQKLGHTITAVFDPNAITETGFISCFAEPEEAAEFLTYKRGRLISHPYSIREVSGKDATFIA